MMKREIVYLHPAHTARALVLVYLTLALMNLVISISTTKLIPLIIFQYLIIRSLTITVTLMTYKSHKTGIHLIQMGFTTHLMKEFIMRVEIGESLMKIL